MDPTESLHIPRACREGFDGEELQALRGDQFKHDAALRAAMAELVKARYEDPTALLDREFARCDTLYLVRDKSGMLLSFELISWEAVEVDGEQMPTARVGLLATAPGKREEMSALQLYRQLVHDVKALQEREGKPVVIWATTANPSVFLGFQLLMRDAQPRIDGSYTPEGEAMVRGIRKLFSLDDTAAADGSAHPFYLPQVAHNTRYSREEMARIESLQQKKKFRLFREMGIDETRGDRMLIVGFAPEHEV